MKLIIRTILLLAFFCVSNAYAGYVESTERLFFPSNVSIVYTISVTSCLVFWLIAYYLIIYTSFKNKTFGMPITSLCANLSWEIMYAFVFPPPFIYIQLGGVLWVIFDILILISIWKYAANDFSNPMAKQLVKPGVVVGMIMFSGCMYLACKFYMDINLIGWIIALMMSGLFIAMYLRRGSCKGQSIAIAVCMFLGNTSAFVWGRTSPVFIPDLNQHIIFYIFTSFLQLFYIWLLWKDSLLKDPITKNR